MHSLIFKITVAFFPTTVLAVGISISEADYLSNIGNCPCPYNTDSRGNLCAGRSAWCRAGGYSPACNLTKISYETIESCELNKRQSNNLSAREPSKADYSGNCPCPYNTDQRGNLCGGNSAWCRAGGQTTFCDSNRILPEMIKNCASQKHANE